MGKRQKSTRMVELMRQLTSKQKKILNNHKYARHIEELPYEIWDQIQEINNSEVLYDKVNGYLWDNYFLEEDE